MGFITDGLIPAGGRTKHYVVQYEETLSGGKELANELLAVCEDDFALMQSWFGGIDLPFSYPVYVKIADVLVDGGAEWPSVDNWDLFWDLYTPIVTIMPGGDAFLSILRYLLVSEVTEMFMLSKGNGWGFDDQGTFTGADEGSKGEGLSRFLGIQFQLANGLGPFAPAAFGVTGNWINSGRQDFIHTNTDDNHPDVVTGCTTLFIFFMHDQLGFSIEQIINAGSDTLADVCKKLNGGDDGWDTFTSLVNSHYPSDMGQMYSLDSETIFPVSDLSDLKVPKQISWFENAPFNEISDTFGYVFINNPAAGDISVALSVDDTSLVRIASPVTFILGSSVRIFPIVVLQQDAATFTPRPVTITATYAGQSLSVTTTVVAPQDLVLPKLVIYPLLPKQDGCAPWKTEGRSQQFGIKNVGVIQNPQQLTYSWSVTGATPLANDQPLLTIDSLPAAQTQVSITVTVKNRQGIHAQGSFSFTTMNKYDAGLAALRCRINKIKWSLSFTLPTPGGDPLNDVTWRQILDNVSVIERQARQIAAGAREMIGKAD